MLVLWNADVRTMLAGAPPATCVAIEDARIVAAGSDAVVRAAVGPHYDELDCGGATLLPGFEDAHIHLLAYAASLAAVDCSPAAAPDIPAILAAVGERAHHTPPGVWIRAVGYRESELRERRHPTRWELDAAAPRNPVRLIHGSGHGSVLNSTALAAVGITTESEEPPGALIGRRLDDGEPDGLLLELNELIEGRIPRPPEAELRASLGEADHRLLAAGVTTVHDLGVRNDAETLALFERLRADGTLTVDVVPALGYDAFAGGQVHGWRGIVKLAINELDGVPRPSLDELAARIARVAAAGARVAVHAVTEAAVERAAEAFARVLGDGAPPTVPHRVEHAAICPPSLAERLAALHVAVVYNPGLLYADGERFAREVAQADQPWLHNPAPAAAAGARIAFGSDAPVSRPDPLGSIAAAARRRATGGTPLPGPQLPLALALWAQTAGGAAVAGASAERGMIAPGMAADLVLLPPGWERGAVRPLRTLKAGRFVEP